MSTHGKNTPAEKIIPPEWKVDIQDHRLIRTDELMYRLNRSREHIRRLRKRGQLPHPTETSSRDKFWLGRTIREWLESPASA